MPSLSPAPTLYAPGTGFPASQYSKSYPIQSQPAPVLDGTIYPQTSMAPQGPAQQTNQMFSPHQRQPASGVQYQPMTAQGPFGTSGYVDQLATAPGQNFQLQQGRQLSEVSHQQPQISSMGPPQSAPTYNASAPVQAIQQGLETQQTLSEPADQTGLGAQLARPSESAQGFTSNGMQQLPGVEVSSAAQTPARPYRPTPVEGSGIDARSFISPTQKAEQQIMSNAGAPGSAQGRIALLQSALMCELPKFLLGDVLENPSLAKVKDPAAAKVHSVELLKLLTEDPGYGLKFQLVLQEIPAWKKYKSQDHSLFITGFEQKSDYFLIEGDKEPTKLLTER